MNTTTLEPGAEPQPEAGFSLIEVLIAIVVLVFGIISVANLMLVAAANNMTANSGSAAVTAAIQEMELLKSQDFTALVPGRTVKVIGDESTRGDEDRGVGVVHVISKVDRIPGAPNTVFLTVIATPISALNIRGGIPDINPAAPPVTRSQAIFTSFRTQEGQ